MRLTRKVCALKRKKAGCVVGRRRRTVIDDDYIRADEITFERAVEVFLGELKVKGLAYHTIRWHKDNLRAVEKILGKLSYPKNPGLWTEKVLKNVILEMVDNGLRAITINHRVRSLKQLCRYLVSEGLIKTDPAEGIERKRDGKRIIQAFDDNQIKALLSSPNKKRFVGIRDYVMMIVLLDTGVRLSELAGIRMVDLKLKENEIIIYRGKGGKSRRVFVSEKTRKLLSSYLYIRGEIPGNEFLFISNNDQPIKTRNIQERVKIYGEKVGIEGVRVSPHTFRHTFAKKYILNGGDIFSLQAILGHATLDMVREYVNLWGSDIQKMHRKYSPVKSLFGEE